MPTATLEPEAHSTAPALPAAHTHVRRARSHRRLWLAVLAIGLVGGGIVMLLPGAVTVVRPVSMTLRDEAVGTGFVTAKVLVGVGAKINGLVVSTHVDQGDRVHVGQILAELQNTDVQGQVRQASHQLEVQRAGVTTAHANDRCGASAAERLHQRARQGQSGPAPGGSYARSDRSLHARGVVSNGLTDRVCSTEDRIVLSSGRRTVAA